MTKQVDWEKLASQLRCPSGENGLKLGLNMADTNAGMTRNTWKMLPVAPGDSVLEIGFGNGSHIQEIFEHNPGIKYTGVDISETMVREALAINEMLQDTGKLDLVHTDGKTIPFPDATFDKVFTVNTLYFWEHPETYLEEIRRVMKPGAICCIAFAAESFMKHLPFVRFGFRLYNPDSAIELVDKRLFDVIAIQEHQEVVKSNTGENVDRTFYILRLQAR